MPYKTCRDASSMSQHLDTCADGVLSCNPSEEKHRSKKTNSRHFNRALRSLWALWLRGTGLFAFVENLVCSLNSFIALVAQRQSILIAHANSQFQVQLRGLNASKISKSHLSSATSPKSFHICRSQS